MSKETSSWTSERLGREVNVVRYGEVGVPVLIFPTAAGDFEECERFLMMDALSELLGDGRIKVYSVDSIAGQAWLKEDNSIQEAARVQNQFDAFIYHELVPAIRMDCRQDDAEIVVTGSSIGAFNALAAICRHPDVFRAAICMSGTYDLKKFLQGRETADYHRCSPLHFLPHVPEGEHLEKLRSRFVLLTHGEGRWEEPAQSWKAAEALGARGIPNRVVPWGEEWDHDWPTWRRMLPLYLDELLPREGTTEPAEAPAEPARTADTPTEAPAQPARTAAAPKKAPAQPARTAAPKKAPAEPARTAAAPKKAPAKPARAAAAPAKAPAKPAQTTSRPAKSGGSNKKSPKAGRKKGSGPKN